MAGVTLASVSYFILNSAPLTAAGMSAILIGVTSITLSYTRPNISPEASELMLKTGMENTAALLEELGIRNKAVYLPSAIRDGYPQALIPLVEGESVHQIKDKISGRLIVRYGNNPEDMAIAVTTPGSITIGLLESRPGPTADEIEAATTYILTGVLDIAKSVSVSLADNKLDVTVKGARLHYEDIWYYRCLGSPIASIVAAISSEALQQPVRISQEGYSRGKNRIILEVLS